MSHPGIAKNEGSPGLTPGRSSMQPEIELRWSAGVRASLLEYLHACPICTGTDLRHYCRVPSRFNDDEFIHYERCSTCGTVLRNPRLPAEYRLERYKERVFTAAQKRLIPKSQVHYWFMMQVISRLLPPGAGRRLLDFGCGAGGFLVEARAAGFDVMGLEVNRDLAEHVQHQHGILVYQGSIDDKEFGAEMFDVIISSQVFEHLLDPRDTLRHLTQHLTNPGLLLIEVPNLLDVRERIRRGQTMNDSHIFCFSRRSLTQLLSAAGFQVLRADEGVRPFRFLGESARRAPIGLLAAAERVTAALSLNSALSVIATPT